MQMNANMMKVLVTGAAGFIGSHVAQHCINQGMQVTAVDDMSGGDEANIPKGCSFVNGDLSNRDFVRTLFEHHGRFDTVYHLAAYAAEGLSHFIRHFNYTNNLLASVNLLNESVKTSVKCLVFTSSIAVYGKNQLPMSEDLIPLPEDPYGIAKYAFELDLRAAHEMFGLDCIIFRPHNVYGENQNIADRYRNVIGIFMNQLLQDKPLSVFGDGSQTRAFSYIADVAPVIAASPFIAEARNETFNVGADTAYTVLELGTEIANAFGKKAEFVFLPERNEVAHAFADHTKVHRVFSPPPSVTLGDGIAKMANWVRARGPSEPTTFSNIELTKNLPNSWLPTK